MGALMRAHDWAKSPLGPPEQWPQPLRTAIRVLLNTGHPMYVWWGPELLCFYNDAYRRSIGPERHPGSLGRPARVALLKGRSNYLCRQRLGSAADLAVEVVADATGRHLSDHGAEDEQDRQGQAG